MLSDGPSLLDTVATLRRSTAALGERKLLIVLDQFEQWLHADRDEDSQLVLVAALRQCDGVRIQCILLVRDDYWMAASRLMQQLEIPQLEGHNVAVVDRFDPVHAEKVLTALGRAYDRLPTNPADITRSQQSFVRRVVRGLAEDDKIVCVRLVLFAQMVKDKPWKMATWKSLGAVFAALYPPREAALYQRAAFI